MSGFALTLDAGFDSKANHKIIKEQGLLPVIPPNRRNAKEPIVIARPFRWFIVKTIIIYTLRINANTRMVFVQINVEYAYGIQRVRFPNRTGVIPSHRCG